MYKDTKSRTLSKTFTWRITATLTTISLVFIFTGRIDIALEVGLLEMLFKMVFYFLHERGWDKVKWGKIEITPFVLWITGIPKSGKTTLGNMIYEELKKDKLKIQRLDSHDVRPLFPETGFTPSEVDRHIKRIGHLVSMLEKNGVITIASFVSPYKKSRQFVRQLCENYVEIYLNTSLERVKEYDTDDFYERAEKGEIKNVPSIDVEYEFSKNTELTLDMTEHSLQNAKDKIVSLIRSRYLR